MACVPSAELPAGGRSGRSVPDRRARPYPYRAIRNLPDMARTVPAIFTTIDPGIATEHYFNYGHESRGPASSACAYGTGPPLIIKGGSVNSNPGPVNGTVPIPDRRRCKKR